MAQLNKKLLLVNSLGGLFYLFALLQWLWAALPYLPGLISFATKLQPSTAQPAPAVVQASTQPPSLALVILASIIVVGILAGTAYILVKLPVTIGKTGQKLTKGATQYLVPVMSHHAPLTPKKQLQLTTRAIIGVKCALSVIPGIAVLLSFRVTSSLSYDITLLVAAFLLTAALLLLSAQLLLTKLLKLSIKDSW